MSTVPAQTGDWNIISGAIITTCYEIISKALYKNHKRKTSVTVGLINNFKIGIVYGLFVDAFKLGS
uniref:Ycf20 n=1 Tax=Laurencia catarinensis TaxID=197326 RepID=UPI0028D6E7F8|nr:Ycf20 [Laurencia catarinensis]WMP12435.1 Ycf20 [Laurencia catarinensis]